MRTLFLSPRECWPVISGAKLRDYYLAKALGEAGELTYAYFRVEGIPAAGLPFCHDLIGVPKPKAYTAGKVLTGLFSSVPFTVINYTSAEMRKAVEVMSRQKTYDLVHLDSIHMLPYLGALPGNLRTRAVMNWHNIESELLDRYAANSQSLPRRAYARMTAARMKAYEGQALQDCLGHLVCSERERDHLLGRAPATRVAVIENGVDVQAFSPSGAGKRDRVLFVGSMSYHANSEGVLDFAANVWPALRGRFPDWTLTVVGSDPPPAVQALASQPGIEVTGRVPHVQPYYEQSVLVVVPLKTGSGTRLKILEAMAAGVPVVSTPLGAEGLCATPGEDLLIASSEQDWITHCAALASNRELWNSISANARRLVEARYDWPAIGRKMVETYRTWLGAANGPR